MIEEELKSAILAVENDEDAATVYKLFRSELTEEILLEINNVLVPQYKKKAFINWYKRQPGNLLNSFTEDNGD